MSKLKKADREILERVWVSSIMSPPFGPEFNSYLMNECAIRSLEASTNAVCKAATRLSRNPTRNEGDEIGCAVKTFRSSLSGAKLVLEGFKLEDQAHLRDLSLDQFAWPQLRPPRSECNPSTKDDGLESSDLKDDASTPDREHALQEKVQQADRCRHPADDAADTSGREVGDMPNSPNLTMIRRLPFNELTVDEQTLILKHLPDDEKVRLQMAYQVGLIPEWNGRELEY
jgi:hypothetical protein